MQLSTVVRVPSEEVLCVSRISARAAHVASSWLQAWPCYPLSHRTALTLCPGPALPCGISTLCLTPPAIHACIAIDPAPHTVPLGSRVLSYPDTRTTPHSRVALTPHSRVGLLKGALSESLSLTNH